MRTHTTVRTGTVEGLVPVYGQREDKTRQCPTQYVDHIDERDTTTDSQRMMYETDNGRNDFTGVMHG